MLLPTMNNAVDFLFQIVNLTDQLLVIRAVERTKLCRVPALSIYGLVFTRVAVLN
jgi:hypothetical protein